MIAKHPWLLATAILILAVDRLPAQDESQPLYKSAYRVINVHRHCDTVSADAIKAELEVCDRVGVSAVVILDGGDLDGKVPAWMELKKRYPDRLIVFSNVPWGRIKRDTFFDDIVRELPAQQRAGIQGVKIFKQLGMSIKGPDGKLLHGDDLRLDPFWAKCGELGLPVLIHMADPKEYWYPLTYNSFHYGMKSEESQFYDRDKVPSWEDLIEQRNNILKKHPKTKFIGAHMGSLTFDLKQLGETFDKYPNFYVDCSARTRILGRLNPMAVRDFFTKYQDRILFGTDSTALSNVDSKDEKAVGAWKDRASRFYSRHLEYFETNRLDIVEPYGWGKEWLRIPGVKLPPEVLEKFYHANAEKLIPGVAKQSKVEPAEKKVEPTVRTASQQTAKDELKQTGLGKLAAGMKPGTWAELMTGGYTAELLKVQSHHILEYTGAATWDPTSRQVLFVGQGHYSALKFISYSADANAWKLRPTPSWWKGDADSGKGPIGHAYYNNAIDPIRGVFYLHQSATRLVHRYDIAKDEWSTLAEIADAPTGHGTAIAYFPERKGLLRVLGGNVHFYSDDKKEWQRLGNMLAMGPYHNVAQYSSLHKCVLFGGGNNSKNLFKLDAEGKITALKEAPFEIGINTAVVTNDPVSGDFLVLTKDDKFYAFNPTTDAWKELPTEGMPFAMKGSSFDVVATPVSNHGVTLFFTARQKGQKACLYKHAAVTSGAGGAKGAWNNLTDEFLKVSGKGDFRMALAVDRATGNLFVSRWTSGVWLSEDQGKTFGRVDGQKVNTGGPFSCHALIASPNGGKLAVFNMNNKPGPSGYSLDRGKTWESFDSVGRNWDYGAVDWDSQSVLALRHEHDGVHLSTDLGKTWTELDLKRGSISGAGVLSASDLVISRGGKIEHSPDGGKSWTKVADYVGNGPVLVLKNTGYWLANKREKDNRLTGCILASTDKGKTWKELGKPMDDRALTGPCFGKDERHIVVAGAKGILETVDGGESWKSVTSYPADAPEIALNKDKYGCTFPSIAYDAVHDVFYLYFFNDKKWAEGQLLRYAR